MYTIVPAYQLATTEFDPHVFDSAPDALRAAINFIEKNPKSSKYDFKVHGDVREGKTNYLVVVNDPRDMYDPTYYLINSETETV